MFYVLWKWHRFGHLLNVRREAHVVLCQHAPSFLYSVLFVSNRYRNHVAMSRVDKELSNAWRNCSMKKSLVVGGLCILVEH